MVSKDDFGVRNPKNHVAIFFEHSFMVKIKMAARIFVTTISISDCCNIKRFSNRTLLVQNYSCLWYSLAFPCKF